MFAVGAATSPEDMSQKTYGIWILLPLRVTGGAIVAEKRPRHPLWVPRYFDFQEENL